MIAVSQCLLGVNCKYNGGNNKNEALIEFLKQQDYIAICPEVMGGLPVPRIPCEIVDEQVKSKDGRDFTKEYKKGAELSLAKCKEENVEFAILQSRSPSCGCGTIYDGTFTGTKVQGDGITVRLLKENGIEVIDVNDLEQEYYCYYDGFSCGRVIIVATQFAILEVEFWEEKMEQDLWGKIEKEIPILCEMKKQLQEYVDGKRREFTLPLNPKGTKFQKKVWEALCKIPYGETRTYKEIAYQVDCPSGSRAVGMANHNNPIGIVIPCHRVIGANGKLVGYAGGLDKKEYLLDLERKYKEKDDRNE